MSLWLKWEEFQSPKRYVKRFQGVSAMPHNRILRLQNVPARSEAACGTTEWRSERLARSMEEQYKISGMLALLFWRRAAQAYQRVSSSFGKCRIPLTDFQINVKCGLEADTSNKISTVIRDVLFPSWGRVRKQRHQWMPWPCLCNLDWGLLHFQKELGSQRKCRE